MADFKQYALEFVLANDEGKEKELTTKAALEIEKSGAASHVVSRWAQSINNWMQGGTEVGDVDDGEESVDNGDAIARARALEFLSGTLQTLDKAILKPEQVKLLVVFFSSLFSSDTKSGITAATTALRHLSAMKGFKPQSGADIVESMAKMGDDFRLQTPSTRLEVYELLHRLMTDPLVMNELQFRHGAPSAFMTDLLNMCRAERDPRNLLKWFEILRLFLIDYAPAPDVTELVFKAFSAYFPISLRASSHPSGITAEDLKASLRECFASHYRLAKHAFPFLLQKLDQGDAVTASVRVDILQTINACLASYEHVQQGVVPFVDKIWMCLKYEVRNGEIQDAITNTLTVLSTLAGRLDGDDLKAFAQAVLNDCLDDLENPTYSSQAGKLLASIFGAKVCAFTHMVPPILSRVKRIHRQTASPSNTKDLFTLLNSILERRLALTSNKSAWQESDVNSMKGASSSLPALFEDVYRPAWEQSLAKRTIKEQRDLLKIAFQGMALLVQQVDVSLDDSRRSLLCPDTTCSQICSILFIPVVEWTLPENEAIREPVLEDEAVVAMQKAVMVYGAAFDDLITRSLSLAKNTCSRSDVAPSEKAIHLRSVLSRLSFIGCSELSARTSSLQFFGVLAGSLLAEMRGLFDQGANFEVASLYLSGIHGAALNLADALRRLPRLEDVSQASTERQDLGKWIHNVEKHFQGFPRIDQASDGAQPGVVAITPTAQAGRSMSINMQFLQLCLFIVYQLYRRATVLAPHGESVDLGLSPDFQDAGTSGEEAQDRYLFSLGRFATFVIRSLSGPDQQALRLYEEAVVLFRGEDVLGDGQTVRHVKLESLSNESTNTSTVRLSPLHNRRTAILSMAILEGLRSEGLIDLYRRGIGESLLLEGLDSSVPPTSLRAQASLNNVVMILSNKYMSSHKHFDPDKAAWKRLVEVARARLSAVAQHSGRGPSPLGLGPVLAFTAGAILRYDATLLPLLGDLVALISDEQIGQTVARSLEVLVSPKACLSAENHAAIKPLYKQWAYAQLVKPNWTRSAPFNSKQPEASNFRIAILALLKHFPFEIYAEDVEKVCRVILSSMPKLEVGPDLEGALGLIFEILRNSPEELKGHLKTLIMGCVGIYTRANTTPASSPHNYGASCRKLALDLLAALPPKYEERYLLPHTAVLKRTLANACGDKVREVRQAAVDARVSWTNVT